MGPRRQDGCKTRCGGGCGSRCGGSVGSVSARSIVPSIDIGNLRAGLRPAWHVVRGWASFDLVQALVYVLAAFAIAVILRDLLSPALRRTLVLLAFFGAVLALKVPIVTRQLSMEALGGTTLGVVLALWLGERESAGRWAAAAIVGFVLVDGLRPSSGIASQAFNWIPFRSHLTNEITGIIDLLAGTWPFMALGYLSLRGASRSSPAVFGGMVAAFVFVLVIEWLQTFIPGRSADITDAAVAALAWIAPWILVRAAGKAEKTQPRGAAAFAKASASRRSRRR